MATDSFLHRWNKRKQAIAEDESRELNTDTALSDHASVSGANTDNLPASISAEALDVDTHHHPIEELGEGQEEAQDETVIIPDMEDVARLKQGDSAASFLVKGVSAEIKKAALRKLFHSDAYNVLDGMNDYDLDYSNKASLSAEVAASLRKWTKEQVDDLPDEAPEQLDAERHPHQTVMEEEQQPQEDAEKTSADGETNSTHGENGDKLSNGTGQNVPLNNVDNNSDGS
ncbi:DUF3306 domain-containing protein [Enterovibrio calviensis]|uniref:DUF3306 domain-containing protein n=1 Tax=Enterovibrio calviensis TaxID=91359 RepID=UPI000487151A|nr:DUF3306 domain-containing protein [Enterovibrio calviensis]